MQPQPLSQARSLEDLRISKEEVEDQQCSFDYQVWDLSRWGGLKTSELLLQIVLDFQL